MTGVQTCALSISATAPDESAAAPAIATSPLGVVGEAVVRVVAPPKVDSAKLAALATAPTSPPVAAAAVAGPVKAVAKPVAAPAVAVTIVAAGNRPRIGERVDMTPAPVVKPVAVEVASTPAKPVLSAEEIAARGAEEARGTTLRELQEKEQQEKQVREAARNVPKQPKEIDRKSTRLNSSHERLSRMPSSA